MPFFKKNKTLFLEKLGFLQKSETKKFVMCMNHGNIVVLSMLKIFDSMFRLLGHVDTGFSDNFCFDCCRIASKLRELFEKTSIKPSKRLRLFSELNTLHFTVELSAYFKKVFTFSFKRNRMITWMV